MSGECLKGSQNHSGLAAKVPCRIRIVLISLLVTAFYSASVCFGGSNGFPEHSRTAFFDAIQNGEVQKVEGFLNAGMRTDIGNEKGMRPLDFLTLLRFKGTPEQQVDIARLLIKHGADVNAMTRSREPVLVRAIRTMNVDLVRLFLESGADPNQKNGTALFEAVRVGLLQIVKLLLEHGANVNSRTEFGDTPLFTAGDYDIAKILLKAGAEVNAVNRQGVSVLKYQTEPNNRVDKLTLELLRLYGAKSQP